VAHISNLCAVNEISRESKQTQKVVTSSILPKWSVIRGFLLGQRVEGLRGIWRLDFGVGLI